MKAVLVLMLPAIVLLIIAPQGDATISLEITDNLGNYTPAHKLDGNIDIIFDDFVPQTARIFALVNGKEISSLSLKDYVKPPSSYNFLKQTLYYNITAVGKNNWSVPKVHNFGYIITAKGICGTESTVPANCPCGPNYPCEWVARYESSKDVNRDEGLKFIYNSSFSITVPEDSRDTTWSAIVTGDATDPSVQLRMRQTCGNPSGSSKYRYETFKTDNKGWITRDLDKENFVPVKGTTTEFRIIIEPFDESSLTTGRDFFDPVIPGGIYHGSKDLVPGVDVSFDGPSGNITILKNFDGDPESKYNYSIKYFPPNGPILCAFTTKVDDNSEEWEKTVTLKDVIKYSEPYYRKFDIEDLKYRLRPPVCPAASPECTQVTNSYTAYKVKDPEDIITFSWDDVEREVNAKTSVAKLSQTYIAGILLSTFSNLKAPTPYGDNVLNISLFSGERLLASEAITFSTCKDSDGDGYCPENGDCDDDDSSVSPKGEEVCDGLDNDCDGEIDEDFHKLYEKLGDSCGTGGEGSPCKGKFVCTRDGGGVVCNAQKIPHSGLREYCSNDKDDDCDGSVDEKWELVNGHQVAACVCKEGEKKPCGSDIGVCMPGTKVCDSRGDWSECTGGVNPIAEICNQVDDNCDNVQDNVNNMNSVESTGCRCYKGGLPSDEVCNGIDDNCNGQVDEGMTCCTDQQTMGCGIDVGVCEKGVQTCIGDSWGPCKGGIQPSNEECFNRKDDNCDGKVDEGCEGLEMKCKNGIQDSGEEGVDCGGFCPNACGIPAAASVAALVMILVIFVALLQFHFLKPT